VIQSGGVGANAGFGGSCELKFVQSRHNLSSPMDGRFTAVCRRPADRMSLKRQSGILCSILDGHSRDDGQSLGEIAGLHQARQPASTCEEFRRRPALQPDEVPRGMRSRLQYDDRMLEQRFRGGTGRAPFSTAASREAERSDDLIKGFSHFASQA
jgi:hypothetical protein